MNRYDITFEESEDSETSGVSTLRAGSGNLSCKDGSEALIGQEELRWELQDVNLQYLENASIKNACSTSSDVDGRSCNFDFGLFPNNLHQVCEKYGGVYEEREHSIQCHHPSTKEQLYYQIDRFPNCFPGSCQREELETMITHQIESVRRALEEDSGMVCYADYDILRHANDEDSAGSSRIQMTKSLLAVAALSMVHYYV
ncbi:MAG: hypothetical protein SGILL_007267 [Bacillariaceae sp.]